MDTLSAECSGMKEQNMKQFMESEDAIYKCLKCNDVFPSSDSLSRHSLLHDRYFKCENCPTKFPTYTQCLMHKRIVHTNVKFDHNCEVCGEVLKLKQDLFSHYNSHALTRGTVKWDKCGMPFKSLVYLKLHELANCTGKNSYTVMNENKGRTKASGTDNDYHASKSSSASSDVKEKSARVQKKKLVCGSESEGDAEDYSPEDLDIVLNHQIYTCPYCSVTFHTKGLHTIHLQTHLKPHHCDICGRGFAKRYTMLSHRKTHLGIKDHACELCGASFTLNNQLNRHKAKHHGSDAKFVCGSCRGRFSCQSMMANHRDACTGNDVIDNKDDAAEVKQTKELSERLKFVCQNCLKEFTSYAALNKHVRTHNYNYCCKFCDHRYNSKYLVLGHVMVHMGIKPYRCTACGATFSLKSQCTRHCSIHLKNQRYTCPSCNLGFGYGQEINRHLQMQHCKGTTVGKSKLKTLWVLDSYDEEGVAAHVVKLDSKRSGLSNHSNNKKDNEDTQYNIKKECDDDDDYNDDRLFTDGLLKNDKTDTADVNSCDNTTNSFIESGSNVAERSSTNGDQSDREAENETSLIAEGTESSEKKAPRNGIYKCGICEKVFRKKTELEHHKVKEHSVGQEPYRCCLCGYGTAYRTYMIKHIDMHLLQKFYRCRGCRSRFASQRSLTSHVTIMQCYDPDEVDLSEELETFEGKVEYTKFDGVFSRDDHEEEESISTEDSGTYEVKVEDLDSMEKSENFGLSKIKIKKEITDYDGENDLSSSSLSISKNDESLSEVLLPQLKDLEGSEESQFEERPERISTDEHPEILSVTGKPLFMQIEVDSRGNERVKVNGMSVKKWKALVLDASRSTKNCKEDQQGWCNDCKKFIPSKYKFRVHMERHGVERPYKCADCEKTFKTSENLRSHSRWHDTMKISKCPKCSLKFVGYRRLVEHLAVHRKVESYACSTCGKEFGRKAYLNIHMRTHTGEMPFKCNICDRRFRILGSLQDHAKIHSGVKPYQCTICLKCFAQRANWKTHEKRHRGFKKHECEVCHKGFVQNYELQNHRLRCVKKDLSYVCLLCGMRFTREHPLKRHLSKHNCSICGEQFVIMKEKVIHQLRCRKEAKKRRHEDEADNPSERRRCNGVEIASDGEGKETGEADDDHESGEWNMKDGFESSNDKNEDYDSACDLVVIKTEEL